jgi:hypothetical protein
LKASPDAKGIKSVVLIRAAPLPETFEWNSGSPRLALRRQPAERRLLRGFHRSMTSS